MIGVWGCGRGRLFVLSVELMDGSHSPWLVHGPTYIIDMGGVPYYMDILCYPKASPMSGDGMGKVIMRWWLCLLVGDMYGCVCSLSTNQLTGRTSISGKAQQPPTAGTLCSRPA